MKIKLPVSKKEIEVKDYKTRKITREYNEILLEGVEVNAMLPDDIKVPAKNIEKSNDYLVKAMTGLSQEEIDELNEEDYNFLLDKINNIKIPSGKSA